jgi:integrase
VLELLPKSQRHLTPPAFAEALLSLAREHEPRLYPIVLAAASTGTRRGELLGLQWADVDFARSEARTTFGRIGVKVWIFKGEARPETEDKLAATEGAYVSE